MLIRPKKSNPFYVFNGACVFEVRRYMAYSFNQDPRAIKWVEEPVHWKTFVESKEHLGLMSLSPRQYDVFEFMFGNDPKQMFFNKNQLAVLLYGKGAGKDTIAAIALLYCAHVLLCMDNPQKFFHILDGDSIDCVNVAPSGDNATTVFFDKVKERIKRWRWLLDKYNITESGASISKVDLGELKNPDSSVFITKDGVVFPKRIRLHSRNSSNESVEGLNTLIAVLDEASAFADDNKRSNASRILQNMRSSMRTRFASKGKMFVLSYPREKDDFTHKMYKENLGKLHVCADTGTTWDIKGRKFFDPKTFEYLGYQIPMDYKEDFDTDPATASAMYLAIPPEAEHGYIDRLDKFEACINPTRIPLITAEQYIENGKVRMRVLNWGAEHASYNYVITVDLGHKVDRAALSIFHLETLHSQNIKDGYRLVQDAGLLWEPVPKQKLEVSFIDVERFIRAVALRYTVLGVYFDEWQSVQMREQLKDSSIPCHTYTLTAEDYRVFRENINLGRYDLLDIPSQRKEILSLHTTAGGRADHPKKGHNDLASTVVGAGRVLLDKGHRAGTDDDIFPEVELLEENLDEMA